MLLLLSGLICFVNICFWVLVLEVICWVGWIYGQSFDVICLGGLGCVKKDVDGVGIRFTSWMERGRMK